MVKKLRHKFVMTAMLSLLVILALIIGVINALNYREVQVSADEVLDIIAENDGLFPEVKLDFRKMNPETPPVKPEDHTDFFSGGRAAYNRSLEMPYQSRYFYVKAGEDGSVMLTDVTHIASVSDDEAIEIAEAMLKDKKNTRGYYDFRFRYLVKEYDDGSRLIVFLDVSNGFYGANRLLVMTLIIGGISLFGMLILVYLFSGKAVAPVVESMEKQKRFITDAGHELKTPLSVISADVDVLELETGESEWTDSIKGQISRMDGLIKNMLILSRMEEENIKPVFSDVDMSSVLKECADSFKAVAEIKNLQFNCDIKENIHINGDKNAINQLASILIDNAIKYTNHEGIIKVFLSVDSRGKNVSFEVLNTCDNVPQNPDRLFDRFYRSDSSRSRDTGGYGIGLSVARAIATSHNGSIEAKCDGDRIIRFIVSVPLNKN